MNRSAREIWLGMAMLFSIALITLPSYAYAQEVSVTSVGLGETTILELHNASPYEVSTVRIWLGEGFNFSSFKTESGWTGEKDAIGGITFTPSETVKLGEYVKFGVKTDRPSPVINWKALDSNNQQINIGMIPTELPVVNPNDTIDTNQPVIDIQQKIAPNISEKSQFRIIPENPNAGSSIRVTGDNFGVSQQFEFYIDTTKLGNFETNESGHFITTVQIPKEQPADRVDFRVLDMEGQEKKISLIIEKAKNRISPKIDTPLVINGVPEIVFRGELLEIFGTGNPNGVITAKILALDGEIINSKIAEVDGTGNWKLEPITILLDATFGRYSVSITDGRDTKVVYLEIESDKEIHLAPTSLKFEPGEIMMFNGTVLPNVQIELVLKNPRGKEIASDIIQVNGSGYIEYKYQTTRSTAEGTYTLIASQEDHKELIFAGLGQLPLIPVNVEFDKPIYKSGDTAVISLSGGASDIISLIIIDPSGKIQKGMTVAITLHQNGRGTHSLDLSGYTSGVYTAVIKKGTTQSEVNFKVGLDIGSPINISTTKTEYHPSDSILILGKTERPNVLLTLTMMDPDGNVVKSRNTLSNKEGTITEDAFRIPTDAKVGIWIIEARSSTTFDQIEIEVVASIVDGMVVIVERGKDRSGYGHAIEITIYGIEQNPTIEIKSPAGDIIGNPKLIKTKAGFSKLPWSFPVDTEPGIYTIKVITPSETKETTYELKQQ